MTSRGYWIQKQNQKKFFESFAKKYKINNPEDWGKIKTRQITKEGGTFVTRYYGGSLRKSLQSVFTEITWKKEWFMNMKLPSCYWLNKKNQRKFFDDFAKKFEISHPSQWNKISADKIEKEGGTGLLSYYRRSVPLALRNIYPEVEWKREWFVRPQGYWKNVSNQSDLFDSLKKKFNIKRPQDWRNITIEQAKLNGADGTLSHYGYSLFHALKAAFPDVKWKQNWFSHHSSNWKDPNIRRKFLVKIASEGNLTTPSDWKRIGISLIKEYGGNGLLALYKQSLAKLLVSNFPEFEIQYKDMRNLSSTQNKLETEIRAIIPHEIIIPNWRKNSNYIVNQNG